jgi:hypothetical protein
MKAYGPTSDLKPGFLRESWAYGSVTSGAATSSRQEYGWQQPAQHIIESVPSHGGDFIMQNLSVLSPKED